VLFLKCISTTVVTEGPSQKKVRKHWKALGYPAGCRFRKVGKNAATQTVAALGTFSTLDKDKCKDNALGKALYHLGRPSVRASCQVECTTQLEQDSNAFHALLEERNTTLQGMHGTVLSIRLSTLSHACMGIQPHGRMLPTLTGKSVSMRPPLSLIREHTSLPA
jgi:hypothetical protein